MKWFRFKVVDINITTKNEIVSIEANSLAHALRQLKQSYPKCKYKFIDNVVV